MFSVSEMISYRKISKERPKCKEVWCTEQTEDAKRMVDLVEQLVATAIGSTQSSQQYEILEAAKSNFYSEFLDMAEKYRYLDTERPHT